MVVVKGVHVASLKFSVRTSSKTGLMIPKGDVSPRNSEDPYETPQNAASHQGLRCFPR